MNVKLCTSLAISIFAYFHTSTFAYCGEAAALLPVIPQPMEWKPTQGGCTLEAAKVEVKVDAASGLGEEGYTMTIAPDAIEIVAVSESDTTRRQVLYWYGDASVAMDSDTDGDGLTFAEELAAGTDPLMPDESIAGGVEWADGALLEMNLQVYEQAQGAIVGGAYSQMFTSPIAGNTDTSTTFGNGGAIWPVVDDLNGDGLWDLVACWEGGVKVLVNVGREGRSLLRPPTSTSR